MIPKECKRLAEVDFPIAKVSAHSAREKSIRHGHPSTLHLWWARRPLAACRSMLMALLLPDPCDPHCPPTFKDAARQILLDFPGRPARWAKDLDPKCGARADAALRHALLHEFIADFANWDNAANPAYLKAARALVKAAHGDEAPLVVDPFAGGGSIPLEALRIGCDAFASDLNPVACLINKVLLEDIPRHGPKLAEELRRVGAEIKKQAEEELAEFYPPDPDGARPIAYLWARTVRCEQPNCGCEIPLVRSWWLCKKASRRLALRVRTVRATACAPTTEFEIFAPKSEEEVPAATVSRAKATCPACNKVLSAERVRAQLREQHGGALVEFDEKGRHRHGGARLLAVVTLLEGNSGRHYRAAKESDYAAIQRCQRMVAHAGGVTADLGRQLGTGNPFPDEPTPAGGGSGAGRAFSLQKYGVTSWSHLFTARQLLSMSALVKSARASAPPSVAKLLPLALSKLIELSTANCPWEPVAECPRKIFNMQAIPTRWEFAEGVPTSDASGGLATIMRNMVNTLSSIGSDWAIGQVKQADVCAIPLPDESSAAVFTDPPYYDAIPYSDLADFFSVWLRRTGCDDPLFENRFDTDSRLCPKTPEIIQDERKRSATGQIKDKAFFESQMGLAFSESRRVLGDDGVACVVFAHKTTEGWEALLGGLIGGGLVIHGSWPVVTEQSHRPRARDSAALASSVHLVCRRRDDDAGIGDWGEIIRELPRRIGDWMERLSGEGIRGADLVFACIGPALELFSKYARVETPDGEEVGLAANDKARGEPARRGFLSYVWEFAGRTALNQVLGTAEARARNGAAGALEEDARLTALFLWTLQATEAAPTARIRARSGSEGPTTRTTTPVRTPVPQRTTSPMTTPAGTPVPQKARRRPA